MVGDGVDGGGVCLNNFNGQSFEGCAEAGGSGQDVDFCGGCYATKYS